MEKEDQERISEDELAYLVKAQADANLANAVLDSYKAHLTQKYKLAESDSVDLRGGAITRFSSGQPEKVM